MSRLRRPRLGGLWGLGALSAAVLALAIEIAVAHRAHWASADAPDYWAAWVLPVGAQVWALVGALAVVGWTSGASGDDPRRGARLLSGALAGAGAALIWTLAAAPIWIWLARLGADSPGALAALAARAAAAPAAGALVAGAGAGALGPGGAWLGAASAGAALFFGWGGLG